MGMDKLVIEGGIPLCGEVSVSGAKNSALPVMAASLLTTIPMAIVFFTFQRYFRQGVAASGAKG